MQAYSDPARANDPHALPDIEVFYHDPDVNASPDPLDCWCDEDGTPMEGGFYWWHCFPGCLPDSEAEGPFATEAEALADMAVTTAMWRTDVECQTPDFDTRNREG